MHNNRLNVLFDKKPRQSKSTSNLPNLSSDDVGQSTMHWQSRQASRSRDQLCVTREYQFKPLPLPPTARYSQPRQLSKSLPPAQPAKAAKPVIQVRAITTPFMHPPDELYLKMMRRRSANACLEERRIQHEHRLYGEEELMSVAIASALPPQYFDTPPSYTSPNSDLSIQPLSHAHTHPGMKVRGRITVTDQDRPHYRDEDTLGVQIDETIAQYAMLRITQATPTSTRSISPMSATISPMNDIDQLYLERRRKKR